MLLHCSLHRCCVLAFFPVMWLCIAFPLSNYSLLINSLECQLIDTAEELCHVEQRTVT